MSIFGIEDKTGNGDALPMRLAIYFLFRVVNLVLRLCAFFYILQYLLLLPFFDTSSSYV